MSEFNLKWSGMLTVSNIGEVIGLLRRLLTGKRYTFVAANESYGFKPEVRTGQKLGEQRHGHEPITFYVGDDRKYAGFNVCDTYGVWGCSTSLTEDVMDHEYRNPYFDFREDQVTIVHRAGYGNKLYWTIAIERDPR